MATELEKREKQEVGTTAAEKLENSGPAFSPDVDIYISEDALFLAIDLPGVAKGDVTIQFDESNALIINAKAAQREPENCVLRQFNIGNYYRAFQLSDEYDKDKVSAVLENGLLNVSIPKREEIKPRKIEIKI
ncbi:MAG TPA: Hsp20/alpha crystallin family protein [Chitinispirillaceae bacterium]|nr:Hsp20/alpha crystallin family protein [Chitinispirillaceae bacterium]